MLEGNRKSVRGNLMKIRKLSGKLWTGIQNSQSHHQNIVYLLISPFHSRDLFSRISRRAFISFRWISSSHYFSTPLVVFLSEGPLNWSAYPSVKAYGRLSFCRVN